MILMSRFCRPRSRTIWPVLPLLLLAVSCSRPEGWRSDDSGAQTGQHPAPFQDETGNATTHVSAAAPDHTNSETGLPFRDDQSLPAGTLLTVRLKNPISAENPASIDPIARGTFEAVVDEPLVINGNTLVPRGAIAAGRVESARSSNVKRRGYVRLILDSIDLGGRDLPVQTSSLFARGNLDDATKPTEGDNPSDVIHLEKGRRLTFRLTEPVYVASQRSNPAH
jgi:hypothetical protein